MPATYDVAYNQGLSAAQKGQTVGANPYDPDNESFNYEAWLDGWSDGLNIEDESNIGC